MDRCVSDSSDTAVWQIETMELSLSGIGESQEQDGWGEKEELLS